jgi:hypothetical protein
MANRRFAGRDNMANVSLMPFDRLEVPGWPVDDVEALNAKLHRYQGGAQMWHLAGATGAAVGIEYPETELAAMRCRELVDEWAREHTTTVK